MRGPTPLAALALDASPALGTFPVDDHWSGLRPGTPDELPILGPDPDFPAILYATGHYRNGILLAEVTAKLIARDITSNLQKD